MKKVLVLAAAIALFAAPVLASPIANSKHNLASNSGNSYVGESNEICVYCHTPHGAVASTAADGLAPLWNRGEVAATGAYNSGTLDATVTTLGVNASDAPLCLSCHDGASLGDALNNEPNSGDSNAAPEITGDADLDTDLSNDHPIGFDFDALLGVDLEIQTPASSKVDVTFGATNDQMWCSSCHDVHNDTNSPFLATSNAGSALCLQCHKK